MTDIAEHQAVPNKSGEIRVWDIAVRVFHWSLVVCFAIAYVTAEEIDTVHEFAGYAILGLVAFLFIRAVDGIRYARFSQFIRSPHQVKQYLLDVSRGKERRHLGHNPAGAAMIVALLLILIGIGGSGWMLTTDTFWGVEWVEEFHELLANLGLILIGLHVAGVVLASVRHHENLVLAMITGRKRGPGADDLS